jgi:hypothetical protein
MAENKPGARAARYLELYDTSSPTSEAEVQALVAKYDLKHGDVLSFDEYRDVESQIAVLRDDGRITLIPNPDDSGSGYLTIPKEVLANAVSDALDLYRIVIKESDVGQNGSINFNLSPQDKFVVDRLGHVPCDWLFDLTLLAGELAEFSIKVPGFEWDTFDLQSGVPITRELIEERYLSGSPLVSIYVRVDLSNGDGYERYVTKYGNTYSQFPSIPSSWLRESFGGGTSKSWGWKFRGPQSRREEVEKSINEFLEGFTYQFVDPSSPAVMPHT